MVKRKRRLNHLSSVGIVADFVVDTLPHFVVVGNLKLVLEMK